MVHSKTYCLWGLIGLLLAASCTRPGPFNREPMAENYGLIRVGIAPLRAEPRHSAEMVDQAIMGQSVRLLAQQAEWFRVRTHYDYTGWINQEAVFQADPVELNHWEQTAKQRVRSNYAVIYSQPTVTAVPAATVTLNACLILIRTDGGWTRVMLADKRQGWIKTDTLVPEADLQYPGLARGTSIVKTAVDMTGVPYLWGGNSSLANDCSGFVQTVFRANGIQLPRDARQQVLVGVPVDYSIGYAELKPADLLFFGESEAITHVAISLGGPRFIHQSGDVHINSLDPADPDFKASSLNTLKCVKRVLPEPNGQ